MRALSRKKSKAILALLENRTVGDAAESTGIGQSTQFRWMQDHNFKRHYLQAKRKVIDQAITQLQNMCGDAVGVLKQIMLDDTNPSTSRIACAKAILDQALKGFELEDLATRIDTLGKAIIQKKEIPAIAIKYLDGSIDWADRIFPNEEEFHKAVERAFKDEPPSPGPDVILIPFLRERSQVSC